MHVADSLNCVEHFHSSSMLAQNCFINNKTGRDGLQQSIMENLKSLNARVTEVDNKVTIVFRIRRTEEHQKLKSERERKTLESHLSQGLLLFFFHLTFLFHPPIPMLFVIKPPWIMNKT